jgi:hypothetical protein
MLNGQRILRRLLPELNLVVKLDAKQPAIVTNMGDTVHVVSLVTLRLLARGDAFEGDVDQLIKLLAKFIVDSYD